MNVQGNEIEQGNLQGKYPGSKVPITKTLDALLNPDLFRREPIFTAPLQLPRNGEKVYDLSDEDINAIRRLRGAVVDLHPGMGGVAPDKLKGMITQGIKLTSVDFMLTQGCNFECTWCYANSGPGNKPYIPFKILKSVTEEAADLGVKLIILTGGEPLTYKDPDLGRQNGVGDHFFMVVEMIKEVYARIRGEAPKILTFDDVALINPKVAKRFAEYGVGLCTKGDTLIQELQDFKVNQKGAFQRMQRGYQNLIDAGYGRDPALRLVVNSVLDHTTFDGMVDMHFWVMEHGFDHSIVPVHYCGAAEDDDQEAGIHSLHVKVLYDLLSRIDEKYFGITWRALSAFTHNKTCNRNRSGLHIRAGNKSSISGDITSCSEAPGKSETGRYTFGNVFDPDFSLKAIVNGERLRQYREEFAHGYGDYVCSPDVCDLNANDLCMGGCAVRSAYSKIDVNTGLIVRNDNMHCYSEHREDALCPAWTVLAQRQGVLREGLLEAVHDRLLEKSTRINPAEFPFEAQ